MNQKINALIKSWKAEAKQAREDASAHLATYDMTDDACDLEAFGERQGIAIALESAALELTAAIRPARARPRGMK